MLEDYEAILNTDDPQQLRAAHDRLNAADGVVVFGLRPHSARRSTQANAFWHGCVVRTFQRFLQKHNQHWSHEQIHYWLVSELMGEAKAHPETGELMRLPPQTHNMSREKFGDLIRLAEDYFMDKFNLPLPESFEPLTPSDAEQASARA